MQLFFQTQVIYFHRISEVFNEIKMEINVINLKTFTKLYLERE